MKPIYFIYKQLEAKSSKSLNSVPLVLSNCHPVVSLQGGAVDCGKAFVDTKVGSSGYHLGCRAATIMTHQPVEHIINSKQNLFHDLTPHPVYLLEGLN